jgi:hypothetical protein
MKNSRSYSAPFHVGGRGASPALDQRGHGGLRVAAAVRFVRSFPMRGQTARSSFINAVPADSPGTRRVPATEVPSCT